MSVFTLLRKKKTKKKVNKDSLFLSSFPLGDGGSNQKFAKNGHFLFSPWGFQMNGSLLKGYLFTLKCCQKQLLQVHYCHLLAGSVRDKESTPTEPVSV